MITEDGTYTMPAGVTQITLVLIGGGDGGNGGDAGTAYYYNLDKDNGVAGQGGKGGKVYSTPLTINDGQQITFHIGAGGAGGGGGWAAYPYRPSSITKGSAGLAGEATTATLGTTFSSANGIYMSTGYVDLLTNKVYAVSGIAGLNGQAKPSIGGQGRNKYGNGGGGGDGGAGALTAPRRVPQDPSLGPDQEPEYIDIIDEFPKNGARGGKGGSGCAIVFYVKE